MRLLKNRKTNRATSRKTTAFISLVLTLVLLLSVSGTALAAGNSYTEVRSLLEESYVDPVAESVLNAPTVAEMLKRLGDPHTTYFSAEEYQDFLNSLDMRFTGIGIYMDIVPEGVLVASVIQGSPAEEAGLKQGDIITSAAGESLAGLSAEMAASILRGPEGTSVSLTVKRNGSSFNVTVTRRNIDVPTVTGQVLDGHIGYIDLDSFGSTTPEDFDQAVRNLQAQSVNSWIIDLRDNPGGYLSSALDMAGFFIGDNTAVQIKDRSQVMSPYPATAQQYVLNQPVVFLTNKNSASASEILSAAVKDEGKATLIGETTYGKGTVQSIFPLTDGGALKMTVARFYSPDGQEINKVGVNPDLALAGSDAQQAGELLLDGVGVSPTDKTGYTQITAGPNTFTVSLAKARTADYWAEWSDMISSASSGSTAPIGQLKKGTKTGWVPFTVSETSKRWPLFYPNYADVGNLTNIPLDKKFTVRFNGKVNWQSVNSSTVELIASDSGQRVPLTFEPLNDREIRIAPQGKLEAGKTYWLVLSPAIQGLDGKGMQTGGVAVASTQASQVGASKVKKSWYTAQPFLNQNQTFRKAVGVR